MKRTLRPFVVETKQGKKPRSWVTDIDTPQMSASRQKAELTAAEVFADFRSKPIDKAVPASAPRVLPDLSRPVVPPPAPETAPVAATADDDLSEAPARPRRNPRPRPAVSAAEALFAKVAPQPELDMEDEAELDDVEAEVAYVPVKLKAVVRDAAPVVTAETEIAGAGRADPRSRRQARMRLGKAELPRGQRWKRRLHPAAR